MNNELMNLIDTVEIENVSTSLNKVASVQAAIKGALKTGHDFDTIPGTTKPTLLKPGAEKILMMFGITSEYEIVNSIEDWKNGVFAYTVKCILSNNGAKITEGLGSCNSKEDKYRYRWVYENEIPVGVDKSTLKVDKYGTKYRIENNEIYSQVNTLLKMAKKRAQIDATLTVASLSEVFTQDIEDMKEILKSEKTDNMTLEDARNTKVYFGKHKGKTLGEVYDEKADYLDWIIDNFNDEIMKQASRIIVENGTGKKNKNENDHIPFSNEDTQYELNEEELPF